MREEFRISCIGALPALFLTLACASLASAQQVAITSPASGNTYAPGATITVTAAVTSGTVAGIEVAAQDIGMSAYSTTAPYSFSFTVPTGVIGPRNAFAAGVVANETAVLSPVVTVDIELSVPPTAINFDQPVATFGYIGQQRRVHVQGTLSDGSIVDITKSTQISFSAGDPTKISVDSTGLMTSLGTGSTTVTVAYGNLTATLQTVGPASVRGDLDGDGMVTEQDLLLLESMVGSTPTGPNDGRDLNGDGKIDNLDVQALLAICGAKCSSLTSTATLLTPSATQVQYTRPLTFTGVVSTTGATPPTGDVSFVVDGHVADVGLLGGTLSTSVVSNSLAPGTHTVTALYNGDANNAPSSSQPVSISVVAVQYDVNGDGVVDCLDLELVKAAFGTRKGQANFNAAADVNHDGVVNVIDLSMVARQIPAGTSCP